MTVLQKPLIWSKSQVAAFKECSRKGIFLTLDDPMALGGRVYELKRLKNRFLWSGSVVHDAIGSIIKELRQGQPVPDSEQVIDNVRSRMREEFRQSQTNPLAAGRLFEHEYGQVFNKEVWLSHWNSVETSLRWFFKSTWLSRLSLLKPEHWKVVDEVLHFDVDGIKAYVKIDCALEIEGRFILIDWKTSALKSDDAQSMHSASLYAHEVWGADAETISAHVVSLSEGRSQTIAVDEEVLMDTYMRIQEEANFLREHKTETPTDPLLLPTTNNKQLCARCNFQKICFPAGCVDVF